jgi:hypothetical protein
LQKKYREKGEKEKPNKLQKSIIFLSHDSKSRFVSPQWL